MFIPNNKVDASGTKRPSNVPNSASSNDAQASKKVKTSVDQSDIDPAAASGGDASMILNTGMYMSFTINSTSEKPVPVQNFTNVHEELRVLRQQVIDMKAQLATSEDNLRLSLDRILKLEKVKFTNQQVDKIIRRKKEWQGFKRDNAVMECILKTDSMTRLKAMSVNLKEEPDSLAMKLLELKQKSLVMTKYKKRNDSTLKRFEQVMKTSVLQNDQAHAKNLLFNAKCGLMKATQRCNIEMLKLCIDNTPC